MGITTYRIVVNTTHSRGEWVASAQIATRGAGIAEGQARAPDEHEAMVAAVREALTENARTLCAL